MLVNNSAAFVFANFNKDLDQNVTCDSTCLVSAGFSASSSLLVHDIWAKADIGTINAQDGYSVLVPRNGASRFLKFTPQ